MMPFLLDVFEIPWPFSWNHICQHLPIAWAGWAGDYRAYWYGRGATYPLLNEDFRYHLPGPVQEQFIAPLNAAGQAGAFLLEYLQKLTPDFGRRTSSSTQPPPSPAGIRAA